MSKKELFRIGLGICVSLAALAVVFYYIDLELAVQALKKVDYWYLLPLGLISLGSISARTLAWRMILPQKLPFRKVFRVINAGYLLNTILPFRMGEIGRSFLLKPVGLGFWHVIPTILVERAFDLLIAIGLFMGALPFVLQLPQGNAFVLVLGVLVLTTLAIFYLMVLYQTQLLQWIKTRHTPWPKLQEQIHESLKKSLSGLSVLANGKRFALAFAWMLLSWALALAFQYLLMLAFIPQAEILWAVFALGAVALGVAVPSSPGNLGIYEASLVAALVIFDIPDSTALAYALLSHIISLGITSTIGAYALFREGIALKSLFEYRKKM